MIRVQYIPGDMQSRNTSHFLTMPNIVGPKNITWEMFELNLSLTLIYTTADILFVLLWPFLLVIYWPATIPGHVTTGKKVASVFELFENSLSDCV